MNPRVPRWQTKVTQAPATLPVNVAEVCNELGLDLTEMPRVERTVRSAIDLAEAFTGRSFVTRTLQLVADEFPTGRIPWWDGTRETSIRAFTRDALIYLPKPPLVAVASVQYYNLANQIQTVDSSNYFVDNVNEPGRIIPNYGYSWPVDARDRAAVLITYTAGYGTTAGALPAWIADAILAHTRDVVTRPNASVSSESIDNASVSYGNALKASDANRTGGLRGDAAMILSPYRILDIGA